MTGRDGFPSHSWCLHLRIAVSIPRWMLSTAWVYLTKISVRVTTPGSTTTISHPTFLALIPRIWAPWERSRTSTLMKTSRSGKPSDSHLLRKSSITLACFQCKTYHPLRHQHRQTRRILRRNLVMLLALKEQVQA